MEETFKRIIATLEERKIWHEVKEHEPVFTSEQAARVRDVPLRWGVKAMVLKGKEECIVVLIRADKRVDFSLLKKLEKTSKIRLATPEEVLEATGCEIGSVPPFGFEENIKTYLDKDVLQEEKVTFNAGLHHKSILMRGKDLLLALKNPVLF